MLCFILLGILRSVTLALFVPMGDVPLTRCSYQRPHRLDRPLRLYHSLLLVPQYPQALLQTPDNCAVICNRGAERLYLVFIYTRRASDVPVPVKLQ
jgi:hypothetical protein